MITEWILLTAFWMNGHAIERYTTYTTLEKCLNGQAEYADNLPDAREPQSACVPVMQGDKETPHFTIKP